MNVLERSDLQLTRDQIFHVPAVQKSFGRSGADRQSRLVGLRLRSKLAALKMRLARLAFEDQKGGFNEDQPRWPKGSGENSGRWSGGPGTGAPTERVGVEPRGGGGHHYVSREAFTKPEFDLSPEARRVFDRFVTGPLGPGVHNYDRDHRPYNTAVSDHLRRYLHDQNIQGNRMTARQAVDFGRYILQTDDERISPYNR